MKASAKGILAALAVAWMMLSASCADRQVPLACPDGGDSSGPAPEFLLQQHGGRIQRFAVHARTMRGATAESDRSIRVWDLVSYRLLHVIQLSASASSIAFTPDGSSLTVCDESGHLRGWAMDDGSSVANLTVDGCGAQAHTHGRMAVAGRAGVHIVDTRAWRIVDVLKLGDSISSLAFNPVGERLAYGTSAGELWLHTMDESSPDTRLATHRHSITALSFDATGTRLGHGLTNFGCIDPAAGPPKFGILPVPTGCTDDPMVHVFDLAKRAITSSFDGGRFGVETLQFNADGTRLLSSVNGGIFRALGEQNGADIYELDTGRVVHTTGAATWPVVGAFFGVEERHVLVAAINTIQLFAADPQAAGLYNADADYCTLEEARRELTYIGEFGHPSYVSTWAGFDQQGNTLSVAYDDFHFRIWDARTARLIADSSSSDPASRHAAAVSSDGHMYAIQDPRDASVAVFRRGEVAPIWVLHPYGTSVAKHARALGRVESLAFHANDTKLLVGTDLGELRVWDLETGEEQFPADEPVRAAFRPRGEGLPPGYLYETMSSYDQLQLAESSVSAIVTNAGGDRIAFSRGREVTMVSSTPGIGPETHEVAGIVVGLGFSGPYLQIQARGDHGLFHDIWSVDGDSFDDVHEWEAVSFDPTGTRLAYAQRGLVHAWDLSEPEPRSLDVDAWIHDVKFTRAGDTLLLGAASGEVLELENGEITTRHASHRGAVQQLAVSPDGHHFASVGIDGAVVLSVLGQPQRAVSMLRIGEADYISRLSSGHYVASDGGFRSVMYRWDGRLLPFEDFDGIYNRPDLVAEAIGTVSGPELERLRSLAAFRHDALEGRVPSLAAIADLPDVRILDVEQLPSYTWAQEVEFELGITGSRPATIVVYDNDVPLPSRFIEAAPSSDAVARFRVRVPLSTGRNEIRLSAVDAAGRRSLSPGTVIHRLGRAPKRTYVLSVGIEQYKAASLARLEFAEDDAKAVDAFFSDEERRLLVGDQSTKAAIVGMTEFLERSGPDDQIIMFFSGHGFTEDGEFFFGTHDINPAYPGQQGLSYHDIETMLDGVLARERLILIDACYSGLRAPDERGLAELQELFASLRQRNGAFVIASSAASERSKESLDYGGGHGLLTWALLEGLTLEFERLGSLTFSDTVAVSRLGEFIHEAVAKTGAAQTPHFRDENLVLDFEVGQPSWQTALERSGGWRQDVACHYCYMKLQDGGASSECRPIAASACEREAYEAMCADEQQRPQVLDLCEAFDNGWPTAFARCTVDALEQLDAQY